MPPGALLADPGSLLGSLLAPFPLSTPTSKYTPGLVNQGVRIMDGRVDAAAGICQPKGKGKKGIFLVTMRMHIIYADFSNSIPHEAVLISMARLTSLTQYGMRLSRFFQPGPSRIRECVST